MEPTTKITIAFIFYFFAGLAITAGILADTNTPRRAIFGSIFWPFVALGVVFYKIGQGFKKLYNGFVYNVWEKEK